MPRLPRTASTFALGAAAVVTLALAVPPALAVPAAGSPAPDADPVPALVAGRDTAAPQLVTGLSEPAQGDPAPAALAHLAAHPDRYHIDTGELAELGSTQGPDGRRTVRFEQRHGGIPVLGGQYLVHLSGQGAGQKVESAGGRYFTGLSAPTAPTVPAETLRQAALTAPTDPQAAAPESPQTTATATAEDRGAVILPDGGGRLTEHYTVRDKAAATVREVYVDATTGTVALAHDAGAPRPATGAETAPAPTAADDGLQPATGTAPDAHGRTATVNIAKRADGTYQLTDLTRPATITTYDATGREAGDVGQVPVPADTAPATSPTPDFPAATGDHGVTDAHLNAGIVYDFYRNRLGRDSLDGKGGAIVSVVNVNDGGKPYPGAFWDGSKMVYGSGGPGLYPYSVALDVAGHEMTHGVVKHTANLLYLGQSGAMDEAIADYFGNAIEATARGLSMDDPAAALLGESLCRTGTPQACAQRRLDGHRTTTADYVGTRYEVDNGGVHLNSPIFSGALWDIRRTLDPLTADRVIYHALADYLTSSDDFLAGRDAVLAAGRDQGLDKRQLRAVAAAFDAHGIRPGWQHRLGADSRTLLQNASNGMATPAAAGGHWLILGDGPAGTGLYTGTVDGRGTPVRLSPEDGRIHSWATTDGTNAAWVAMGGSQDRTQDVLTAPLSGAGPVRSVFRSATQQLGSAQVSGPDIVFTVSEHDYARPYLSHDGGAPIALPLPEGHSVSRPVLKDGLVAWTETWQDGDRWMTVPTVYSIAAGKVTAQYTAHAPAGSGPSSAGSLALAGGRLLWVDVPADHTTRSTIRSAAVDGSGVVDLVSADSPHAPFLTGLTASDQTVTYQESGAKPAGGWTNAALPKLWQVPLAGGTPQRLSCNRGGQYDAAADQGSRVIWLDATAGRTDLVVRDRPAGTC
ncbi:MULTISPECIES: M4 family metallopeptidase [unclassified Kitasatospora]|uniref:M4 family metallopeptidase n=1 Tax=unclassified Kitasatospora TaxID=2633591 RepID=UPI00340D4F9D